MFEQPHVAERVQRHAAGQHQPVAAGGAEQMIDDMDHGVFEHQLRRRRLVEAILGVGPVLDVLDAQHRVRDSTICSGVSGSPRMSISRRL